MSDSFKPSVVNEIENVSVEQFEQKLRPAAQPVVLKGLVKDWPAVTFVKFAAVLSPIDSEIHTFTGFQWDQ